MIVPQFLRFYGGYTADSLLSEYAVRFFSLVNSMYRLESSEKIDNVHAITIANAEPKDRESALKALEKSSKGLHGIIEEVKTVKRK